MLFKKHLSPKLLLAEFLLIIASVFIFRSLWLLMDKIAFLSTITALIVMLIIGIGITIPALRVVLKQ